MYPFNVVSSLSFYLIVSRQSVFQPLHSVDYSILIKMTACLRRWTKAYKYGDAILWIYPWPFDEANCDLFIAKLQMHGGCFSKLLVWKAICICPTVAIVWTSLTLYLIRKYSNCAIVFLKAQFWVFPLAFIHPWSAASPGIFEMTF